MLAALLFAAVLDGRTLRVTGTDAGDTILVRVVAPRRQIALELTAPRTRAWRETFALDAFDRLRVEAGAGSDFVDIIDSDETLDAEHKVLDLDAGDGDDVVVMTRKPFPPAAAARVRSLLEVAQRMRDLTERGAAMTVDVMQTNAMQHADRVRTEIADEVNALVDDAQRDVFAPMSDLLERRLPAVAKDSEAVTGRLETFAKELDTEPDDETRLEALEKDAAALRGDAEKWLLQSAGDVGGAAAGIQSRAEVLHARVERVATTAEALGDEAERDLTASADRIIHIFDELQSLRGSVEAVTNDLRDELQPARAHDTRAIPLERAPGVTCGAPATTQTFAGGTGNDVFLPLSAPNANWSIDGNSGNDVLMGGFGNDDMRGGDGNDFIMGWSGNDNIHGGDGNDVVLGEFVLNFNWNSGDDCLWGDKGIDVLAGDNLIRWPHNIAVGGDTLDGGDDDDLLSGDDLTDVVSSSLPGGSDNASGGGGVDLVFGCGGPDPSLSGGDDVDLVVGNGDGDVLYGNDGRFVQLFNTNVQLGNLELGSLGNDEIHGGKGVDVLVGDAGDDTMWGDEQFDFAFGATGLDEIHGESGGTLFTINNVPIRIGGLFLGDADRDRIWGGGDLDVIIGGLDDDQLYGFVTSYFHPLGIDRDVIVGGGGNDFGEGDNEFALLATSNDVVVGGDGNDTLRGGSNGDFLDGGPDDDDMEGDSNALTLAFSHDFLSGDGGNDNIRGGNGNDFITGGDGNDDITGDDEAPGLVLSCDFITGDAGDDTVNSGSSPDAIIGGPGDDKLTGDSDQNWQPLSADFIDGGGGNDEMRGGNSFDMLLGDAGCDHIYGDENIFGHVSKDFILAGAGDDSVEAGVSPDVAFGGDGNDTMIGDDGSALLIFSADLLSGGDGCDTLTGGRAPDLLYGGGGSDHIDGQWSFDILWGDDVSFSNDGNDLIHGGERADVIRGGPGDDCLYGDDGLDWIHGNDGDDCIHGDNGRDTLFGDDGNDLIFGDAGPDRLRGGDGDDQLDGGSGNDRVRGDNGTDEAWGGSGLNALSAETTHSGDSGLSCSCDTDQCSGRVCVYKFHDRDGNGAQDPTEASLANWSFVVTCECTTSTLVTDGTGKACGMVYEGPCTVTEVMQPGWAPTTSVTHSVQVVAGQTTQLQFGNRREGTLCIRKFNDRDHDGVQDAGEPGMSGWHFLVTGSGGVTPLMTQAGGNVCEVLPLGTYVVQEQQAAGWFNTTPSSVTVTLGPGTSANVTFGNAQ